MGGCSRSSDLEEDPLMHQHWNGTAAQHRWSKCSAPDRVNCRVDEVLIVGADHLKTGRVRPPFGGYEVFEVDLAWDMGPRIYRLGNATDCHAGVRLEGRNDQTNQAYGWSDVPLQINESESNEAPNVLHHRPDGGEAPEGICSQNGSD
jgi:hypothetical protein